MRYIIAVFIAATLATITYAWHEVKASKESPDVQVIGGPIFDPGILAGKKAVKHVFHVVNPHVFTVAVSTPVPGCSCTTATISASTIPPHGSIDVSVSVEPEDGAIAGSTTIVTSHGDKRRETTLFINAQSEPPTR